jgi:hypothetical protein
MVYESDSNVELPSEDVLTWAFCNDAVADEHPVGARRTPKGEMLMPDSE